MLGLFKRNKIEIWEIELLRKTIQLLPIEYAYLQKQIDEGLFKRVLIGLSDIPGYVCFSYNPEIAKKFENKKVKNFKLTNIKIFDLQSKTYLLYSIYVSTGRINGYSITGAKKFKIDLENIKVAEFKKEYRTNYQKIEALLNKLEKEFINPSDVYEVVLDKKTYFHVKDLEDGDFIGIDLDKNIYKITHDPYEIILLNTNLEEVLK